MEYGLIQQLKSIVPNLVMNISFMVIIIHFQALGTDLLFNFVTLKREQLWVKHAKVRMKLKSILVIL